MDDFHAAKLCELMEQIELHLRCISNSIYRIPVSYTHLRPLHKYFVFPVCFLSVMISCTS